MTTIEIGTGLPVSIENPRPAGIPSVAEAARRIEELGFESLWVPDLILGDGTPAFEATQALAAAAAVTERVGLGFSVLIAPLRPTPWLAAQVATLQGLSSDRVLLGIGSGGFPDAPFWQALGVRGSDRGALTDDTLRRLPRLLAGEPVEYTDGQPPLTMAPAATMPPVLVGGSERAFGRVVDRHADWFPSLVSPDGLAGAVGRLRELAADRGAPTPGVTVGGHLIIGDDAEARAAYDALVDDLVTVRGKPADEAARVPMRANTPGELADVFLAYADAGADRVVVGSDNRPWTEQLDFIAEARSLLA